MKKGEMMSFHSTWMFGTHQEKWHQYLPIAHSGIVAHEQLSLAAAPRDLNMGSSKDGYWDIGKLPGFLYDQGMHMHASRKYR